MHSLALRSLLFQHPQAITQTFIPLPEALTIKEVVSSFPHDHFIFLIKGKEAPSFRVAFGVEKSWAANHYESKKACIEAIEAECSETVYGGFAFPARKDSQEWVSWSQGRWVLPKVEWEVDPTGVRVTIRSTSFSKTLVDSIMCVSPEMNSKWSRMSDHPNKEAWSTMIDKATALIKGTSLEKVVLARKTVFLSQGMPPKNPIASVIPENFKGHVLCVQNESGEQWLSFSPESLYIREGGHIHTESIAGTSRLDDDVSLYTDKNKSEHEYVTRMILKQLEPLTKGLCHCDDSDVLKLTHIQHLWTKISADLNEGVKDSELIHALFPTPAVCGTPTKAALTIIPELEPFDRGLYTGIAGIISPQKTHLIVNIRAALFQDNKAILYAGAGIVSGSEADSEWDELESKITLYLRQLNAHVS